MDTVIKPRLPISRILGYLLLFFVFGLLLMGAGLITGTSITLQKICFIGGILSWLFGILLPLIIHSANKIIIENGNINFMSRRPWGSWSTKTLKIDSIEDINEQQKTRTSGYMGGWSNQSRSVYVNTYTHYDLAVVTKDNQQEYLPTDTWTTPALAEFVTFIKKNYPAIHINAPHFAESI